jgi:nucleotide-binding universal stress UspA family protein
MGTLASACVRSVPTDVLIVRDSYHDPFRTVVVGIDFSATCQRALEAASLIVHGEGARLYAAHVVPDRVETLVRLRTELGPELNAFVNETTRSVFNPWMRGEAQAIIMEIAERLEGLAVFDATSLFLEHKLVNMRKRYVTRRLAVKLAPLTARALERLEGRLAAELDNGERARLARRAGLYRAKLEF